MNINWGGLLNVALVSFGAAVGAVVLGSVALVGLSARARRSVAGGTGSAGLGAGTGTAVAALCLLATAGIVGYGLWIIIN